MSCPTCDHTMNFLAGEWFWCPRCGTTMTREGKGVGVPYGVAQARAWLMTKKVSETAARRAIAPHVLHPEERIEVGLTP